MLSKLFKILFVPWKNKDPLTRIQERGYNPPPVGVKMPPASPRPPDPSYSYEKRNKKDN